ncbi:MAG: hypothetical protein NC824_03895, partial [Candidatus Omnitrophica bacterium]|nr:hypothetical protein [Candidatus Omnitrophota bacterium]
PDTLNIIVSKPQLIFRQIEFPFRNKKKVYMVIPSELEETLPESIDNFFFSFDMFPSGKNKTVVNVYAIHSELVNYWNNIAKKYKAKLYFLADTLLFYKFLKQSIDEKDYIAIYVEDEYLLLNIIENGILTGSYSYELTQSAKAESITLIEDILKKKKYPLFICGAQEIDREFGIVEGKVQYISLPAGTKKKYLFHHLSSLSGFKRIFLPLKLFSGRKFSVSSSVLLFVFFIISFLLCVPYFKVVEKQKELIRIEEDMRQIFISTFPDVQVIVNPLIQAREKIIKTGDLREGIPSVLEVMVEITVAFPENIDAKIDLFRVMNDTITLSGNASSLKTLEKIKDRIEKSERFTIIDVGKISFDVNNRANFTITLKVN